MRVGNPDRSPRRIDGSRGQRKMPFPFYQRAGELILSRVAAGDAIFRCQFKIDMVIKNISDRLR
jgi:hypothetical protein